MKLHRTVVPKPYLSIPQVNTNIDSCSSQVTSLHCLNSSLRHLTSNAQNKLKLEESQTKVRNHDKRENGETVQSSCSLKISWVFGFMFFCCSVLYLCLVTIKMLSLSWIWNPSCYRESPLFVILFIKICNHLLVL